MKHKSFFLLTLLWLMPFTAFAQQRLKFGVADFHQDQLDLTARNDEFKRTDDSGSLYAIIKVKADVENDDLQGFLFDFGYMNSFVVMHDDLNELWVYVQKNAKTVTIRRDGYLTLNKYDLRTTIEAGCTYVMRLQVAAPTVYTQMVMFQVQPKVSGAFITIKGEKADVIEESFGMTDQTGGVAKNVPYGTYTYKVFLDNYYPAEGRFTLANKDETHTEQVVLRTNSATVTLTADTDAEIYVDGNLVGRRTWTGPMKAGTHQVECRQTNHRSSSQSITVAENETAKINLTPPSPITGTLAITSRPLGAKILIDGQDYGKTPKNVSGLLIGKHVIELMADSRQGAKQEFEIKENEMTTIELELAENVVSLADDQTFTVTGNGETVSFKMILVDGGTFTMGATSEQGSEADEGEKPTHQVTLSSYYIGETEVTQALWEAVMGSNPSYSKGANRPVEQVSWDDCQIFIGKLNSLTGKTFRLPSEAEWEFAARGGTKSRGYKYSGSNNLTTVSWYTDNSGDETHPVKKKKPNELGIYDMSGNVWEWCQDGMQTYISTPQTNPIGENTDSARLLRGGSCINSATTCRVANRFADKGSYRTFGFRLALFSLFQNGIHR